MLHKSLQFNSIFILILKIHLILPCLDVFKTFELMIFSNIDICMLKLMNITKKYKMIKLMLEELELKQNDRVRRIEKKAKNLLPTHRLYR